jgi:hypothetical protein
MRTTIIVAILPSGMSSAGARQLRYLGDLPPASQPPGLYINPYGSSPLLYDSQGQYRGNLNSNPYDPNTVANPYGRHGSPYSPYRQASPNNPYGQGIGVYRNPP